MDTGYVLIRTEPAVELDVYQELLKVPDLKEVWAVLGDWDVIAKVTAEDAQRISDIVVDVIRTVPGIQVTETLLSAKF